jgi:hypothetical protein
MIVALKSFSQFSFVSTGDFLSKSIFLNKSLEFSHISHNKVFSLPTDQFPPTISNMRDCISHFERINIMSDDSVLYWLVEIDCISIYEKSKQQPSYSFKEWVVKKVFNEDLGIGRYFVLAEEKKQFKCLFGDCFKMDINTLFDNKDEDVYEKIALLFGSFLSIDSVVEISNDDTSVIFAARSRDKNLYIIGIDKNNLNNIFYCDDPRFREIKIYPDSIRQTDRNRMNEIHKLYYNSSNSSKMPFRFVGTTKHF